MSENEKLFVTIITFAILVPACMFIPLVYCQPGQVTLKPADDTYTDSINRKSNYGGESSLEITTGVTRAPPSMKDDEINQGGIPAPYSKIVWLKFNLSSVPNGAVVDMAVLQLYATVVAENGGLVVKADSCSDNTWTELTLTYSNMPCAGMMPLDFEHVSTSNQWYNWSVVDVVRNVLNGNPKALTIALMTSLESSASSAWFWSKEAPVPYTDCAPRLTVYWSYAPTQPPTPSPKSTPTSTSITTYGIIGGALVSVIITVGVFLLIRKRKRQVNSETA